MKEEKDEKILINELENKRVIIEPFESDDINSQDSVIIYREAEKPVRLQYELLRVQNESVGRRGLQS